MDAPAPLAAPHLPIIARLVGILGPIGLAVFLALGYACGLGLYTTVSPLEDRGIWAIAGILAFLLIAVWPTFGDGGMAEITDLPVRDTGPQPAYQRHEGRESTNLGSRRPTV